MLSFEVFWTLLIAFAAVSQAAVIGDAGVRPPTRVAKRQNSAAQASARWYAQAQAAQTDMNYGWQAVGCWRDSPTRTLNGMFLSWDNMTLPICMNQCFGKGYSFGGVQYGRECWCGNQINSGTWTGTPPDKIIKSGDTYGTMVDFSECQSFPCAGDASTSCGNNWRNNIFRLTDANAASSAIAYSSSASAASQSASIASVSAVAYSSSAAQFSATSLAAFPSRAATFSASSLAAYSTSASAFSSSSAAAAASSLAAYSKAASAFSQSSSTAAYSASVVAAASSAAAWSQSSAAAYSASTAAVAASAAAYSSSTSAAAVSAAAYSTSSAAAASSAATYSRSAAAFSSSAAAYSQSAAAFSSSSVAASASAYSQSAAAYSQSAAAYSQSVTAAAASASAYSQSAAAYSQSAAAFSQSSVAAYSESSVAAYSRSAAVAFSSQSVAAYSSSSLAASAAAVSQSAAAYSQSTAAAAASASAYSQSAVVYSQSAAVAFSQQSLAAYSQSAAGYSQSVAAASASAYSKAAGAFSQSVAAASASAFSQAVAAFSASSNAAAASATAFSQSVAAYSASVNAAQAAASQAAFQSSVAAYSASVNNAAASASAQAWSASSAAAYSASAAAAGVAASAAAFSASAAAYSASVSAAAAQATAIPSGWPTPRTQCVAEGTTGRALTGASTASQDMTYGKCIAYCQKEGFVLAGLEYSNECYCGNVLANGASLDKQSQSCNMNCGGSQGSICGGPGAPTLFVADSAISQLSSDFTSKPIALPQGWSAGQTQCISEGTTGRALTGASTAADDMTVSKCASYCQGQNFQYAGLEFGRECYCGNELTNGASWDRASSTCNMACPGNPSTNCGGPNGLQIYNNPSVAQKNTDSNAAAASSSSAAASAASASSVSVANAAQQYINSKLPTGWAAASTVCIQEVDGRALSGASTAGSDMTVQKCASFCSGKGFTLAGLEYSGECYCGNSLVNGASLDKKSGQCNMPCSGDSQMTCGGPAAIQLYSGPAQASTSSAASGSQSTIAANGPQLATNLPSGWSAASTNCIQEVAGRALTGAMIASNDMTIAKCIAFCTDKGFKLAGVEYAAECFCGNDLSNGASMDLWSGQCVMPCAGDSKTLCGGPNAIQLYSNPNAVAASPSSASSAASSPTAVSNSSNGSGSNNAASSDAATSTSSAAKSGPTPAKNLPAGWSAASSTCIAEVQGRALTGYSVSQADMTIPKCLSICDGKGFQYAAVEYASECFCGSTLSNGASLDKTSTQCNMGCSGDATTLCGGPDALQLYNNQALAPDNTVSNDFVFKGCMQEVVGRALNMTRFDDDQMTVDKCTSHCASEGYKMAGLEHGTECFCGNSLVNGAAITTVSYECKMACPGDSAQTCGGPDAINLYASKSVASV